MPAGDHVPCGSYPDWPTAFHAEVLDLPAQMTAELLWEYGNPDIESAVNKFRLYCSFQAIIIFGSNLSLACGERSYMFSKQSVNNH
jgi:hypothetical protein